MKLNRQQQHALFLKIQKEIQSEKQKQQEIEKQKFIKSIDPKQKQLAEDYYDLCKSLDRPVARMNKKEDFVLSHFYFKNSLIQNNISYQDIETEYHLSTIECDNLDEIISKIKAKFL